MIVDLVKLRVVDLGYSEGGLTRELIGTKQDKDLFGNDAPYSGGAASAQGLLLCPAVVAPEVAIQLGDELTNETIIFAMVPIPDELGIPRIFSLSSDSSGKKFDAFVAPPTKLWDAHAVFIFAKSIRA